MPLSSLPPETLSLVLEFLADEDLTTLILAQRVCKSFQASIERILFQQPLGKEWNRTGPTGVCPLLLSKFKDLFEHEKEQRGSNEGWSTDLAFRRLPWAAGRSKGAEVKEVEMRDSPYLRPEASWRRLSVTFGAGPGVRSVDVVKVLTVYGGMSMRCTKLVIPSSTSSPEVSGDADASGEEGEVDEDEDEEDEDDGEKEKEKEQEQEKEKEGGGGEAEEQGGKGILTMGLLYDLLASGEGLMGSVTMGWQFLPGTRLSSYKNWEDLRARDRYPRRKNIMNLFVKQDDSAVLFVAGHRGCTKRAVRKRQDCSEEDVLWEPDVIGGIPIVMRPWQGSSSK
ncbi:hypothetical protein Daesc_004005 [Daldinia eschscholtzii]|uniref:F-box domain-containing protein n=1 Tax=Daldinia eschscholtzii TaxID=292717 RepID=A0AAX6MNM3_9PEZI